MKIKSESPKLVEIAKNLVAEYAKFLGVEENLFDLDVNVESGSCATFEYDLQKDDNRYAGKDPKYKDLDEKDIPLTESLKDTVKRFLPCWKKEIAPIVKSGKRVIISGSHNSLRALVKYLDKIPDKDIPNLTIPLGIPLVYELDDNLKPIRHYYLGDPEKIEAAKSSYEAHAKKEK